MNEKDKFVVVKFHKIDEYAVSVFSGLRQECETKAAYMRGVFHGVNDVTFGVFPEWVYDKCKSDEIKGGDSAYDSLPNVNWTTRTKFEV